jgi:hypothetical protein
VSAQCCRTVTMTRYNKARFPYECCPRTPGRTAVMYARACVRALPLCGARAPRAAMASREAMLCAATSESSICMLPNTLISLFLYIFFMPCMYNIFYNSYYLHNYRRRYYPMHGRENRSSSQKIAMPPFVGVPGSFSPRLWRVLWLVVCALTGLPLAKALMQPRVSDHRRTTRATRRAVLQTSLGARAMPARLWPWLPPAYSRRPRMAWEHGNALILLICLCGGDDDPPEGRHGTSGGEWPSGCQTTCWTSAVDHSIRGHVAVPVSVSSRGVWYRLEGARIWERLRWSLPPSPLRRQP